MKFRQLADTPRIRNVLSWVVVVAAVAMAATLQAAPRTPESDAVVLERLPFRAGDSGARELTTLRTAVASAPADPEPAAQLAQHYYDLAIARGDPRYVGYAQAVVSRFSGPLPPSLLTTRGMLRQYRHDFDAALSDFAGALAQDPGFASAHAWRAAIYLVQANYGDARKECEALQRLRRAVLLGGCSGLVQAYTGQLEGAYQALQLALGAARDVDQRLWLFTRLGEVAAWRGQGALAERHFREALSLGRDDGYLLAAWADFLLDNGRPKEVLAQLAGWESSDGLLLRLAEAEAMLKLPDASRHSQALGDRFAAAKMRGDTTHRAEEARYQLHLRNDPQLALRLAAENYRVQREPRDARILLEAAIAAKDPVGAQAARDWLRTSGFEDLRWRRLGQQSALAGAR